MSGIVRITSQSPFLLKIMKFFGSKPDDHVRISDKGRRLLNDKLLSSRLADAIIKGHKNLSEGQPIQVDDKVLATLVTTHVIGTTE